MEKRILGIHQVRAIAGDPQANLDFYAGVLGLRLVSVTVNFDEISVERRRSWDLEIPIPTCRGIAWRRQPPSYQQWARE